tara:strand:- start:570 stop:1262 length:693 start_codon:yes stop_codon:yes gene_type:complete
MDLKYLKGLDHQIDLIKQNTKSFLSDLPYNHALLWGVRGSGKSTLLKGVLKDTININKNLKILEVNSNDINDLPHIFLNYNFKDKVIIFIDDLSFEQNDRSYIQFKSILEGSFYNNNLNVLFYVTSNRRHLMKRDMIDNERSTAISQDEGIEEKVSLSDRFGLWISFHNITKEEYLEIVKNYFASHNITFNNLEKKESLKWIFSRGNRTGRSAFQFFKNYCSINKIKLKI